MGAAETGPGSAYPREFAAAGDVFRAAGALWLLLEGGLAVYLFTLVSRSTPDTNVLYGRDIVATSLGVLAVLGTIPGLGVLAVGVALRAGVARAPIVALVASAIAFGVAVIEVALSPGLLQPGGIVRWSIGLAAVSLAGGTFLLLVQGFLCPTIAADETARTSTGGLLVKALGRSRIQTRLLCGGALAFIVVCQIAQARAIRSTSWDKGPTSMRSDLTLALQATGGPQAEREGVLAELALRGRRPVLVIVHALGACPMTLKELNQRSASVRVDEICTEQRVFSLFDLLGDLGGPDAIAELRRWVRSAEATPALRDQAGAALGRTDDAGTASDIASLLDVPDPPPSYRGEVARRRDLFVPALVKLHATVEIPHIASTLLRVGPHAQGVTRGLRALGDFDVHEGWRAFLDFARSSDPEWRRSALSAYNGTYPLPIQVTDLCLQELDDDDTEVSADACLDLMAPDYDSAKRRYPDLYALTGNPCTQSMRVSLIRDAIAGRPLPMPEVRHRPFRGQGLDLHFPGVRTLPVTRDGLLVRSVPTQSAEGGGAAPTFGGPWQAPSE